MNIQNKYTSLGKSILSSVLCAGVLTASMGAQAEVSQVPLGLSEGVPPNMIFTLDDSTSMNMAFAPDDREGARKTRRAKSAYYNPIYYNPSVTYNVPPLFDSDGNERSSTYYTGSYTNTPINGFNLNGTKINLSNGYKVSWNYNTSKGISDCYGCDSSASRNSLLAENPKDDFSCTVSVSRTSGDECTTAAGLKVKVSAFSSKQCKVESVLGTYEFNCDHKNKKNYDISWEKSQVPAYYYVYDENLSSCSKDKNKDSCYKLVLVSANSGIERSDDKSSGLDERQNFSNWYAFYKTRALATLSAASIAFYDLDSNVRFTWQDLISCPNVNTNGCGNNKFKSYTNSHKKNFYKWLQHLTSFNDANGTPLRSAMTRAGSFLDSKTSVAWDKYPNDSSKTDENKMASNKYVCRASYHVLMTDGMWNSDNNFSTDSLRNDNKKFTLPDGKEYSGSRSPYSDSTTDTLADVAMHYWSKDLSGIYDADNKMLPYIPYKNADKDKEYWDPRNNPATWPSMSNFVMGLGLTEALSATSIPWGGSTFAGKGYENLVTGTPWPAASQNSEKNVYDLWHSAINSRGEFYSVDSPDAMVQAFSDILSRIADRKSSATMPGISTSLESDGAEEDAADRFASYFYQTTFDSGDGWTGDIQKVKKYRKYNKDTNSFEDVVEQGWSAKQKMPAPNSRKIMIAGAGASKLKEFSIASAGNPAIANSLAYYLNINPEPGTQVATWEQRLEYLRGSSAHAGESVGKLRPRSSILGDFLTSQPVVVKSARYLEGFANRLESPATGTPTTTYSTFMDGIAARRGQLYIGGNDGMLHAFDTETGVETFAFIPTAVFPKLNKLTGKNYSHEFYVDGTPVVADVYDGSKWRTILVGTLRAGGKGLFALDITNPDDVQLLWEFGENSINGKDAVKPGYSFPQPTVARLHNGKWAVVTGNGYQGNGTSNGAAALYVIDAITGEMLSSLEVQSPVKNGGENGLSSPRLADYDSDGIADYAYAGDLHGNLWRFDLLGAGATAPTITPPTNGSYGGKTGATTKFAVSYGGKPMFTATSTTDKRQSITSAPSLVRHPTRKGYLVMFGTGKYFELGDKTGEVGHAQTLYGIWDMKTKAESTGVDIIARTSLAVQTIGATDTTGTGKVSGKTRDARIVSNNPVEWYKDGDPAKGVVQRGWRLDLKSGTGEMIIENMRTLGSMLLLQSLEPNADPCANGSTAWLYAINPATGGRTLHHAFDTRAANEGIVTAIKFGSEGGVSISQSEKGFTANAPGDTEAISPPADSMGRQTWRMVPDA